MPFRTRLVTAHISRDTWELTHPLVWQGEWQYIIIREGFHTDFASIPKVVRWLLDNAGANAEAGVLHDAAWRESKLKPEIRRIDPWFADGMLRRALRETGSTALVRTLIWFGVRIAASVSLRLGKKGPSRLVKIAQLTVVAMLGVVTALVPTIVAVAGLVVFWIFNWIFSVFWYAVFEKRVFKKGINWPWPVKAVNVANAPETVAQTPTESLAPSTLQAPAPAAPPQGQLPAPNDLLVVIPFRSDPYTDAPDADSPTPPQLAAAKELAVILHDDPTKLTDEHILKWAAMVGQP
jgi:Protein of unknown function (DUF1353)